MVTEVAGIYLCSGHDCNFTSLDVGEINSLCERCDEPFCDACRDAFPGCDTCRSIVCNTCFEVCVYDVCAHVRMHL